MHVSVFAAIGVCRHEFTVGQLHSISETAATGLIRRSPLVEHQPVGFEGERETVRLLRSQHSLQSEGRSQPSDRERKKQAIVE